MSEKLTNNTESRTQKIAETVWDVDASEKSLTGRTPERIQNGSEYESGTGIPTETMFPENARILYVGDPWQRMGREIDKSTLTLIDYEYGEVASFETNEEKFRERITSRVEGSYDTWGHYDGLLDEINELLRDESFELSAVDSNWLDEFKGLVINAHALANLAVSDEDYTNAAESFAKAREFLEGKYKEEIDQTEQSGSEPGDPQKDIVELSSVEKKLSELRKNAWYICVDGERGFRDIPDYKNLILPKINAKRQELQQQDLPENEIEKTIANFTRGWIEDIRLKKSPENANVVEAMFPQLPFADKSFDRFVASWSISAHLFATMEKEDFDTSFDELYRVLDDNGEAYIFPLNYCYQVDNKLLDSLQSLCERYPDTTWEILDGNGIPVDFDTENDTYSDKVTLVIYKK